MGRNPKGNCSSLGLFISRFKIRETKFIRFIYAANTTKAEKWCCYRPCIWMRGLSNPSISNSIKRLSTTCTSTANTATRISELKCFNAKDGVHYISAGYKNLTDRVVATVNSLLSSPQRPSKPQCHFLKRLQEPGWLDNATCASLGNYTEPGWNGSEPAAQTPGARWEADRRK